MKATNPAVEPSLSKKNRFQIRRWVVAGGTIFVVLVVGFYSYYRYTFPYGSSHCCDLILYQALQEYAASHKGAFPAGGPTSEASLSMLYSNIDWVQPDLLRGRTVSEAVVREALKRDGRLGPESCGWHYVEGLRIDDDPRLAVFWDKIGLGHNGQRRPHGGHTALFVDGDRRFIPESDWAEFLSGQQQLLQERTNPPIGVTSTLMVGGRQVRAELRVIGDSLYGRVWDGYMNTSSEILANVDREPETGVVGIPVVTRDEIRAGRAVVDPKTEAIRFLVGKQEWVFDVVRLQFRVR